jgi:hypothetical protein
MKTVAKLSVTLLALTFGILFNGCLKDGKDGAPGAPGIDGVAGPKGESGDGKCQACHNDSSQILAKILQYRNSVHSEGATASRQAAACARCHTNEGFVQFVRTGIDSFPGGVADPTPQNCRTCHMIHTKYDTTDFRPRVSEPVLVRLVDKTIDYGDGNVCANCHQPRTTSKIPTVGGDSIKLTSTRYNAHHGTQATMTKGLAGYEVPGSVPYTNSEHVKRVTDGCPTCHMPEPATGFLVGGHTLKVLAVDEETGAKTYNLNGCNTCHAAGTVKDMNYKKVQDTIAMLMDSLEHVLVNRKIMKDSTGVFAKAGTYSADEVGAVWNYNYLLDDKSGGNHNYPYAKALLINSIESMQK